MKNGDKAVKTTILLVEDSEKDAETISSILQDEYNISIAYESAEALRKLYLEDVDLILLDINLGDRSLSGFQLIDYLRMHTKFDRIKIIAITGHSLESMESNASYYKFESCLYKPFSKEKILSAIETALYSAKNDSAEPKENPE